MRVLYDHQIFGHQRYGGISRYFSELWMHLKKQPGVELRIVAGLIANDLLKKSLSVLRKEIAGVALPGFLPPNRLFSMVSRLFFEETWGTRPADLYHPTYYRWLAGEFTGRRVITVYDMIHEKLPQYAPQRDPTSARKKFAVGHADGIICLSKCASEDLQQEFGVSPSKIRVIYPAASLGADGDPDPERSEPYILYVGVRSGYKNFDTLIRSLREAPDVARAFKLACFGGGPPSSDEMTSVREAGFDGRATFMNGSDQVLASAYRRASVLVFPSLYEGFGLPVLEAMQAGCPVIVSNKGSLPEIAGNAALYFDPGSSEDLARQLRRILGDDTLRRRLVSLGRARAKDFSWERTAAETVGFYREILAA